MRGRSRTGCNGISGGGADCRRIYKKDAGFVYKLLPVLVSMSLAAVLIMVSAGFLQAFRERDQVDQLAREYLLIMETKGYLSQSDQESLLQELSQVGLTQMSLSGTTTAEVSYGERITLCIDGVLSQSLFGTGGISWELPVSMRLHSTAKQ